MEDHEFFTDFCRERHGPTQMEYVMSGKLIIAKDAKKKMYTQIKK